MTTVATLGQYLEELAPLRLAESWDNVGLLVGDRQADVRRVMTCLTLTPSSVAEAVAEGADLVVPHHPLPFRALKQLTTETAVGRMLLELVAARTAVYSLHTAFDSAEAGINQRLAVGLGLDEIAPLVAQVDGPGAGRWGRLAAAPPLDALVEQVKQLLRIERLQVVGAGEQPIRSLAIACGAADEFLEAARQRQCDALLLGEARFHTCLEAEAAGMALVLPGHFASERFAAEALAELLAQQFPELEVWASRQERDPLRWA